MDSDPNQEAPRQRRRGRAVGFRVAAILVGLVPLLLIEVVLRATGIGLPSDTDDPYIGFSGVQPLFVKTGDPPYYYTSPARHAFFAADSFAAVKSKNEFRIFCLGGSTVHGRPYSRETSFTSWLEISLRTAAPEVDWEVVNCGGVSYASYRLVPILEETLAYEPDLYIIYTGHNEFLEDRTYEKIKQTPGWITAAHGCCARIRTYNVLRSVAMRARGQGPKNKATLPIEVEARLDYRDGLKQYHRDDVWREGIVRHFEFNVRRMVQRASANNVPVIIVDPVVNLIDTPPFKSVFSASLDGTALEEVEQLWLRAQEAEELPQAIDLLEQLLTIDDRYAAAHYALGISYGEQGRIEAARESLIRAKDEDVCPLRITEPMRHAIRDIARQTSATRVDLQMLFTELSPSGLTGKPWLVDHVHPSIRGHQRIADALQQEMQRRDMVRPVDEDWKATRQQRYQKHLATLDPIYYEHARIQLDGLRRWAGGQSRKVRDAP